MEILEKHLDEIFPYEKNPRKNDKAVKAVAESIREFGFKVPIVIDKDGVIVAGHTRYKAATKLGLETVPCIMADDLNEQQVKAFRLADNKTGELAGWDFDILPEELEGILDIDMSLFGFSDKEKEQIYSQKVNIPQYEITGAMPSVEELCDTSKVDSLIEEINEAKGVTKDEKEFLKKAAMRHCVFDYRDIAEYYAHATPEMQKLMEQSALVLIDYNDAIAYGYVKLSKKLEDLKLEGMKEHA